MATEKRLIDANELKKKAEMRGHCIRTMVTNYHQCVTVRDIDNAPTVDAVEVVHGRWVIEKRHTVSSNPYMDDNYHAHATCSECDFCIDSSNGSFGFPKLNTTNYCPNCGAKMDGDGNG